MTTTLGQPRYTHYQMVHFLRLSIDKDFEHGGRVLVGTLPKGALVLDAGTVIATAFDGGRTVGAPETGAGAGAALAADFYAADDTDVLVDVALGSNVTVGQAVVVVTYVPDL